MGLSPNLAQAAGVTTLCTLVCILVPWWPRVAREDRRWLLLILLLMLPMNALVFHALRVPLDRWLAVACAETGGVPGWVRLLYAPLTEEPAKLWPFLIPCFRRRLHAGNLAQAAVAIGVGFGIGEAWNVAALLSASPALHGTPWYGLGGFIGERLLVCVVHAGLVAAALHFVVVRKTPGRGVALAMALHALGNAPILLLSATGLTPETRTLILGIWVALFALAMGAIIAAVGYGHGWCEKLFPGTARCPGCGEIYRRPLFRINLLTHSIERCPLCKRWHRIGVAPERPEP